MSSYYNIFKDTEFVIQNTNSKKSYKLFKHSYQKGGDNIDFIYEDVDNSKHSEQKTKSVSNNKFIKSCKKNNIQNFKQPIIQIGGFYIQL